jgi:hypothetical protein
LSIDVCADGVIVGNHRCGLSGYDLNRQWRIDHKNKHLAPEIYYIKSMIYRVAEEREVVMYCDLHGHKYFN